MFIARLGAPETVHASGPPLCTFTTLNWSELRVGPLFCSWYPGTGVFQRLLGRCVESSGGAGMMIPDQLLHNNARTYRCHTYVLIKKRMVPLSWFLPICVHSVVHGLNCVMLPQCTFISLATHNYGHLGDGQRLAISSSIASEDIMLVTFSLLRACYSITRPLLHYLSVTPLLARYSLPARYSFTCPLLLYLPVIWLPPLNGPIASRQLDYCYYILADV